MYRQQYQTPSVRSVDELFHLYFVIMQNLSFILKIKIKHKAALFFFLFKLYNLLTITVFHAKSYITSQF